MSGELVKAEQQPRKGLLATMSQKYGLEPDVFERTVYTTCMPNDASREELVSCLVVANEHNLNPLTKELHFMRTKAGGIMPIVGYDGWVRKCNEHPQFDGLSFQDNLDDEGNMISCTVTIYRKDRKYPTEVTEYMDECVQQPKYENKPGPWQKTPKRMLRNRTLTQGARLAFGFAGVMAPDEFEQWQDYQEAPVELPTVDEDPKPEVKVEVTPKPDPVQEPAEKPSPEPEPELPPDVIAEAEEALFEEIEPEPPAVEAAPVEESENPAPPDAEVDDAFPDMNDDFPDIDMENLQDPELPHGGLEFLQAIKGDIAELHGDPESLEALREEKQHLIDRCRADVAQRIWDHFTEAGLQ